MSSLNPEAAPYVPGRYRAVEDYSPEWWELVESSRCFRDYWLRECFLDPETHPDLPPIYHSAIPRPLDGLFHPDSPLGYDHDDADDTEEEEEEWGGGRRGRKEMVVWGAEKWGSSRRRAEAARYGEKAPKIVRMRVSPRTIQQPK